MGKKTKLAVAIAAASAAAWAGSKAVAKPQKREVKEISKQQRPLIFAHHGGAQLAPSLTLPAFEKSDSIGVDGFTVCVRLTKDEEIVLFYDEKVDHTTNGTGYIKDMTLAELNELNHGYQFQSLDCSYEFRDQNLNCVLLNEILLKYPKHFFIIDIKDDPDTYEGSLMPSKLWRLVEELGVQDRIIVCSDYSEQTDRFNLYARNSVALGSSDSDSKKASTAYTSQFGHLYNPKIDVMFLTSKSGKFNMDQTKYIKFLNNLNVTVFFKHVHAFAEMDRAINMGADGIITDRPDIAALLKQN